MPPTPAAPTSDRTLDALVRIACYVCDTPIVVVALAEGRTHRLVAVHGWPDGKGSMREAGFFTLAGRSPDVTEVCDATADPRTVSDALVSGQPHARYLAGVSLGGQGMPPVGALVLMDREPRKLTPTTRLVLRQLGTIASRLIETRVQPSGAPEAATTGAIDAVTGLADLAAFESRIGTLLSSPVTSRHALVFLDLDQFRTVEEAGGKNAADDLLRQVAHMFAARVRRGDTLAYLRGDKFGVLLERCPLAQAQRVAQQLIDAMRDFRFVHGEHSYPVGTCAGVVEIANANHDAASLIESGHSAARSAKAMGRNRSVVCAARDIEDISEIESIDWVARISTGLQDDRFYLSYQRILPVFAGDKEEVEFFEVLLRLSDEQGQAVPTGELMAKAHRLGLMPMIDRWVTRTLFRALGDQARAPGAARKAPRMFAMNISAASIVDSGFLEFVIGQFKETGAPHSAVCFDISETAAVANLERTREFVLVLKELGCRFALDDFGSALTSIGYLKTLPVDFLKIDGEFVRELAEDPVAEAMVKSINDIGHLVGMQTIAESVENDVILDRLRLIGVDYIQGYGIHMPVPFAGPNAKPTLPAPQR